MMDKQLYHQKFSPLQIDIVHRDIVGFDIETYGMYNKFYMGSVYSRKYKKVFYDVDEMKDFIIKKLKGCIIFAHNLQFDIAIFWNEIKNGDMKVIKSGSGIILCKYPAVAFNGRYIIYFYDSLNYIKAPLSKIGKIIGIEKMEKPDFLGKKPRTKEEREYLEKYNLQDSKIVFKFGEMLQDFYNKQNIKLNPTVSGCAMLLYRTKYLKNTFSQIAKSNLPFIYSSYAGGRTEVFKRGLVKNLYDYDVNSMYPDVMKKNEFPIPRNIFWSYDKSYKKFEGFTEAIINCPKCYIPYLHNKKDKLLFPTGKIRGVYTNLELRNARERGYIIKPIKTLNFPITQNIFDSFVNDMYNNRMECKKNDDIREMFYKTTMNSLYGKFAQKSNDKYIIEAECNVNYGELANYLDKGYEVKKENGFYFIKDKMGVRYPNFVMPFWSSYVTAFARTELYKHFENIGFDNIYYCDTDSVFTDKKIKTSNELGKLKLECKIKEAVLVKPKIYGIKEGVVRAKGCRVYTYDQFEELLKTKRTEYDTFIKIGSAMRFGKPLNCNHTVVKNIDLEDDKRIWEKPFNPLELQDSKAKVL